VRLVEIRVVPLLMQVFSTSVFKGLMMKRFILIAALILCGIANASADTDIYENTRRGRPDRVYPAADQAACGQIYDPPRGPNNPPSTEFRQCMLQRGWKYDYTRRDYH
jgi:hypothetical protein